MVQLARVVKNKVGTSPIPVAAAGLPASSTSTMHRHASGRLPSTSVKP
jgi:hypothetical protein